MTQKSIGPVTTPRARLVLMIPAVAGSAAECWQGSHTLQRSLEAFVNRDVELARAIPAEDDEVDALYEQIYRELATHIMADPKSIDQANLLLWAAHNLERTADRVTNIYERVVFTVTGKMEEMNPGAWENGGIEGVAWSEALLVHYCGIAHSVE